MSSPRDLEIVLLGATGYTGKLCAEHIAKSLPTNLAWGIAGRSSEKLENLSTKLQALNKDRKPPGIICLPVFLRPDGVFGRFDANFMLELLPVQFNDAELKTLACKTKVVINCVGPYRKHSTPVVKACAENGTHYVDVYG